MNPLLKLLNTFVNTLNKVHPLPNLFDTVKGACKLLITSRFYVLRLLATTL